MKSDLSPHEGKEKPQNNPAGRFGTDVALPDLSGTRVQGKILYCFVLYLTFILDFHDLSPKSLNLSHLTIGKMLTFFSTNPTTVKK